MKKVIHVITGLGDGGAEGVLYRLCTAPSPSGVHHQVVALTGDERYRKYEPMLQKQGVNVVNLGMPSGRVTLTGVLRLFKLLRAERPDVVQCWLYHADFVGGLIARLAGVRKVFWGIRHSDFDAHTTSRSMRVLVKLCSMLSGIVPHKIICCAERARLVHQQIGYKGEMVVVQNGYDLKRFQPVPGKREALIDELNLSFESCLVGMVARYNAQKNHGELISAFADVIKRQPMAKLLLVGFGVDQNNQTLANLIRSYELDGKVFMLGQRDDIPGFMSALDIHILASSYGEGFPNVVAESMSCGTPNVVTDIGDAFIIVGDTGWVAQTPGKEDLSAALEVAITSFYDDELVWTQQGAKCRTRISENFSLEQMILKFEKEWGISDSVDLSGRS